MSANRIRVHSRVRLVLPHTPHSYETTIPRVFTRVPQYAHYTVTTASSRHQHHTPISTRQSFGRLYISNIEIVHQGLSSVGCCVCWVVDTRSRQGESIRYWRLRQEKVNIIHHMGAGVVPSSSWVLFLVMVSRGACLRNCHLLCGLSHHHRCDALEV